MTVLALGIGVKAISLDAPDDKRNRTFTRPGVDSGPTPRVPRGCPECSPTRTRVKLNKMSATPRRKPATYEDILALPEHLTGEILDGELFALPRPSPRHARASSGLGGVLFDSFDRPGGGGDSPGGWWILDEPELHLGVDIVVPDIAGWRRQKMNSLPEKAFIELPPDWVCEVLSPTTEAIDRGRKMRTYGREGVSFLWLLNPTSRTLESYRLVDSRWTLLATFVGDETIRAEPFEAVTLDMSRWWVPETKPESG